MTKGKKHISDLPDLLAEWDYEKNKDLYSPDTLAIGSHKIVWWICENGHSYQTRVYSRVKGNGCPYCSGRKAIEGINDLKTVAPELAEQWNYKRNTTLPENYKLHSNKKVWWICPRGHEWQAIISDRASGNGCPICSGKKTIAGLNDLSTLYPEVLNEWDEQKNFPLTPNDIAPGSHKKVWWKCIKGHSYKTTVYAKAKLKSSCPICLNKQLLTGYNDFKTLYPHLMKEWDFEKNQDISPESILGAPKLIVWWKCIKGHSFQSSIDNRARTGSGCPICSNRQIQSNVNDLFTKFPELYSEKKKKKNKSIDTTSLSSSSQELVWWKCIRGHEWKTTVANRVRSLGCPKCYAGLHTSFPEQAIYYYLSQCYKAETRIIINGFEVDVFLPELNIGIEYDGVYYHENSSKREQKKNDALKNAGITLYRIKEDKNLTSISVFQNVYVYNPSRDYSNLKDVIISVLQTLDQMSLQKSNVNIDINRDAIDIKSQYWMIVKKNSIKETHPLEVQEWNYDKNGSLLPELFTEGCQDKVWWRCKNGHDYFMRISHRVSGHGCPICAGQIVKKGFNDLKTTNPELVQLWDTEKNDESGLSIEHVSKGCEKQAWWICNKGHSFKARISSVVKGSRCPYCSGRLALTGINDLVTTQPELVKEWDYEKNKNVSPHNVTPGSGIKVWWICKNGHSYKSAVYTRKNSGCPVCAGKKVIAGYNDLATRNPIIAEEWISEKNKPLSIDAVSYKSGKKVWWKCKYCGFEWQATINDRSRGRKCPNCSKKKRGKKIKCIETGEVFLSIKEATERKKLYTGAIGKCLRGQNKTAGGFHWELVDE